MILSSFGRDDNDFQIKQKRLPVKTGEKAIHDTDESCRDGEDVSEAEHDFIKFI